MNGIQEDLFKSFERLQIIRLRSQNVRKMLACNNKWLNSLNPLGKKRTLFEFFVLVIYQAFSNVTFYEFPDEDFCHFKSFPHENNVFQCSSHQVNLNALV